MNKNFIDKIVSIVFHPVFIPIYTAVFYLLIFDDVITDNQKEFTFYTVLIGTLVLPISTLSLLLILKLSKSIHLKKKRERIIPIFTSGVYIFVAAKLILNLSGSNTLSTYLIGIVISLSIILLALRKYKISLHTSALAASIGFMIYTSIYYHINLNYAIAIAFFILGLVSTSRLRSNAHSKIEVYLGIIVGLVPQLLFMFLN